MLILHVSPPATQPAAERDSRPAPESAAVNLAEFSASRKHR
jgi:hypothetical protein